MNVSQKKQFLEALLYKNVLTKRIFINKALKDKNIDPETRKGLLWISESPDVKTFLERYKFVFPDIYEDSEDDDLEDIKKIDNLDDLFNFSRKQKRKTIKRKTIKGKTSKRKSSHS